MNREIALALTILIASPLLYWLIITPRMFQYYTTNELWKYYSELAKKSGLKLKARQKQFVREVPTLSGKLGYEEVEIGIYARIDNGPTTNVPVYNSHISIETIKRPQFRFSISTENLFMKVAKEVWATDIQTGYPTFDKTFMLVASDEKIMLELLSEDACKALASFGTSLSPEIKYENGLLKYKEQGIVELQEDRDRMYTILLIMLEICDRLRKLSPQPSHFE